MIKLKLTILVPLLLLILFTTSCIDKQLDFDSIKTQNWSAEWAIPLINSQLTLDDIVKDSSGIIHEGEDGLVVLVFDNQGKITFSASDLGFIPDQQKLLDEDFIVPDLLPGEPADIPVEFLTIIETDEPGMRIDSCFLNAGEYEFILRTDLNRDNAVVEVTIPNLVEPVTGTSLHFNVDVSNPSGGEIERDTLIPMTGFTLVFDETTGPANELTINTIVHTFGDENSNNSPYHLEIENNFTAMDYSRCFGYFGQQVITKKDTIYLNMFSVNDQNNFTFGPGSIDLRLDISNSFGIPVLLDVTQFTAYHGGENPDSLEVYLFGEDVPSAFEIDYPSYDHIGESAITVVNTNNSNINEAVGISAGKMCLTVDGHLNPAGDTTANNFALDSSMVDADFAVEVGLFGSVSGFKVIDTVDFNLGSMDEINSLLLVLDAENGYPLTVSMQLEFVDSIYQVVHTVFPDSENIIEAAPVGPSPEYRVTGFSPKLTQVVLSQDEIEKLKEARQILITAMLFSTNNDLVKVYMDYYVNMKIGVKVGIDY
jgi:hypothetical protein